MNKFRQSIIDMLHKHTKLDKDKISELLEVPPDSKFGDFAFPCFSLAKTWKKNPNQIAQELAEKIDTNKIISKIEIKGPYVNFLVNKTEFAKQTLTNFKPNLKKSHGKIIIEICSPNTNKPLHLGHLRNIFLGESISHLFVEQGFKITKTCIINDRGIHIAKSMLAYQKYGNSKEPDKKPDHFVGDYYVLYNEKLKQNPELEEETKDLLRKWEQGDKETLKLWEKMNSWVYKGFDETYKKLNFTFDQKEFESQIYKKGIEIVLKALKQGIFEKEEGAVIVKLEQYKLPNKILIRSDGTSIYITQDIYLAQKRYEQIKPQKMIYVVANEQNLHFKQLFKILEILGRKWAKDCYHLNYGMVDLPEGRMKSREGTVIDADDIIKEMRKLAQEEIIKRHSDIIEEELEKRSKAIGDGALRFFMLKIDPYKDMIYDPKQSISFEGETGPYVQYTHARICSIIRKHRGEINQNIDYSQFKEELEHALIKKLSLFVNTIEQSANHYKPSILCRYLVDLAQLFNEFYHKHKVLTKDEELTKARLLLVDAARQVLKKGLNLLSIQAPEKM